MRTEIVIKQHAILCIVRRKVKICFMRSLLKYLAHYKIESCLAPLFKLLEACFELIVPLIVARIIDIGIATHNRAFIVQQGILLVGMATVGMISAVTAQYFAAKAATRFGTDLRDDLFRHVMGLSRAETLGVSTLITRLTNDTVQIQNGVNMFFRLVLRSPFIVAGALVMAYTVKGVEGVLFTLVVAVLSVIVFFIMRGTIKLYRRVQQKLDGVLQKTAENLSGVRVMRAFRRESAEQHEYTVAVESLAKEQVRVGHISACMNPLTYAVINMGLVGVLYTGAVQVNVGSLTQGQVIALVNYISQILVELLKLANLIILLSKAAACAKRVSAVFLQKTSLIDGTEDARAVIPTVQFSNVTFTYPEAASPALADISFSVEAGETVGIIGGTGSGKTTLAHVMARRYDVTEGTILFGKKNITSFSLESLRKTIGIVEQRAQLFSGTIADNLRWGNESATDQDLMRAAKTAQAAEIIAAKDGGLSATVEQQGKNFSGGQKQRLSITRTLVQKPRVLILDDAASALDFATDAALRKAIHADSSGMTVFIISQRVSAVRSAGRIIVLDNGQIVGFGTHAELVATCAVYKEICLSQLSTAEVL